MGLKHMSLPYEFTEDILDSLAEGIYTVNKDFKIISFNRAAEKITGYERDEVLGKFCKNIMSSERCMRDCPIARVLENGENIHDVDNTIVSRNGKEIPIKLNAAIFKNSNSDPIGGVVSFRDMSYLENVQNSLIKQSQFHGIIGQSKIMREIYTLIREIADTNSSVFLGGESGTGKELIANAIQAESSRSDKPYIKVNCSVFPNQLLSSELFGHVRGAFTDAKSNRIGRFEMADGGTIFLDEIAEIPLQMQLQLLRVLQEGTFERVGESVTRQVDVRIIAATNIDIEKAIRDGKFRDDLYYRLNVIPIEVPSLRERKDDIPHLIRHFIDKLSLTSQKKIKDIDDEALECLLAYPWPGNIRELENAIEYAFARSSTSIIHLSKLPPSIKKQQISLEPVISPVTGPTPKNELIQLLEEYHWNKSLVAKKLGIGRTTLWRKMKSMGLQD
jgi:PAS domain S-box-containing protein